MSGCCATLSVGEQEAAFYLIDERVANLYAGPLSHVPAARQMRIAASEEAKSYERLSRSSRGCSIVAAGAGRT